MLLAPRAWPPRAVFGIDEFASKALLELLGVESLGEAKDIHVGIIATERMAAGAQRQALAEKADGDVIAAEAALGRERHLVRPVTIDRAFAELAFSVDQRHPRGWSPPALSLLAGGGGAFAELAGGVREV